MASGVSAPFIRRPIATTLLMIGVFLVGLAAYPLLPVAPLPQVDFPTIQVSASLPGASPETMASSVAQPLERQFAQISGVSQLTSTSALGTTTITMQFDLDRNIDAAAQDVQAAINAASGQLPKNLPSPPTYRKVNPADSADPDPVAVSSDTLPMTDVDDYAGHEILRSRSARFPASGRSASAASSKPAVRVQIDPAKLAAKGLSLEDVRSKIAVSTVDLPKGTIDGRAPVLHDLRQRSADLGASPGTTSSSPTATAPRSASATRPGDRRTGRRTKLRLVEEQAGDRARRVQAAWRQRHRDGGPHQEPAAAAAGRRSRRRSRSRF